MGARSPLIVVGGGIAGLATALAAAPLPVLLLARASDGIGSASVLAQGGIAAAIGRGDSAEAHARDTCIAGGGHNDAAMVRLLTQDAVAAIAWLQSQRVAFDRDGDRHFRLAREGGHGCARIVHAGGDASGAVVVAALAAAARKAGHIQWRDGEVDGLLLRGEQVCGVRLHGNDARHDLVEGRAVVLASGGCGALFARSSNPAGADGAGLALALAAGARLRDMEFMQFHPTALDLPGVHALPLVTEALRGAGARLLDAQGRPLMAGVHALGDLAPRDLVARRVWAARQHGGVQLDARMLEIDWLRRFPTVFAACMAHGIDPRTMPIPVTPAAHFHMGGIASDGEGRSSLPGLFAVGEVACSGVHGANRLASNSLLECVVFGRRLGLHLARQDGPVARGRFRQVARGAALPAADLRQLQALLWQALGPVRHAAQLQAALHDCDALAQQGWQGALARAMAAAAVQRKASLGTHFIDAAHAAPLPSAPVPQAA